MEGNADENGDRGGVPDNDSRSLSGSESLCSFSDGSDQDCADSSGSDSDTDEGDEGRDTFLAERDDFQAKAPQANATQAKAAPTAMSMPPQRPTQKRGQSKGNQKEGFRYCL